MSSHNSDITVWKTIQIGTGFNTPDQFRRALGESGCSIGQYANELLDHPAFTVAREPSAVSLVNIRVADLGFTGPARRRDIYNRAIERGLQVCSAEVGPQLRLQYTDQPDPERLVLAMQPFTARNESLLEVFGIARVGNLLWLGAYDGHPDSMCDVDERLLFCRRTALT